MNPFEFVIALVAITTIGSIIRAKYGIRDPRGRRGRLGLDDDRLSLTDDSAETMRLRDEVKQLKDRIQTLERIAVDKENSLAREIDSLRDR
jgi:hypothetical protein